MDYSIAASSGLSARSFFILVARCILAVLGAAFFSGFTVAILWATFVVPLGVPPLSISTALGLIVLINLLRSDAKQSREKHDLPSQGAKQKIVEFAYRCLDYAENSMWDCCKALLAGIVLSLLM